MECFYRSGEGLAWGSSAATRYIVAQYCGGQSALVRVFQSRLGVPLAKMRSALFRVLRADTGRFAMMRSCADAFPKGAVFDAGKLLGEWFKLTWRRAWGELVMFGECELFERHFVWFAGDLQEV